MTSEVSWQMRGLEQKGFMDKEVRPRLPSPRPPSLSTLLLFSSCVCFACWSFDAQWRANTVPQSHPKHSQVEALRAGSNCCTVCFCLPRYVGAIQRCRLRGERRRARQQGPSHSHDKEGLTGVTEKEKEKERW